MATFNNEFFDTIGRTGKLPPVDVVISIDPKTLTDLLVGIFVVVIVVVLLYKLLSKYM